MTTTAAAAADFAQQTASPTSSPRGQDARRVNRQPRVREIVIYPDAQATDGDAARLADVSTFGLGFVQARPMVPGAQFVLRLELADGNLMPLLFRVAHCRPTGEGNHRVGAQLLRVINGNESVEINAETDAGVEFAEAVVDVVGRQQEFADARAERAAATPASTTDGATGRDRTYAIDGDTYRLPGATRFGLARELEFRREDEQTFMHIRGPGAPTGWAILVDSAEFEEIVAISRAKDAERAFAPRRVAA